MHIALYDGDSYDINSVDLFSERKVLREIASADNVSNTSLYNNVNSSSYGGDRTAKLWEPENY